MIITTSGNTTQLLIEKAVGLSLKYNIRYHMREGRSVEYLLNNIDTQIFVVNNLRGLSYYEKGKDEAFYHPNMAVQRIINLKKGFRDNMASACGLEEGMSFFDGTLGLAADSLTASYIVGERGMVTAAEKSLPISILAEEGLKFYAEWNPDMASCVNRISIKNTDNIDFMRKCKDSSFDVVYFDFMFSSPVESSKGLHVIRNIASSDEITEEHICEALRVAASRVVVKSNIEGMTKLKRFGFSAEREDRRRRFYYAVMKRRSCNLFAIKDS